MIWTDLLLVATLATMMLAVVITYLSDTRDCRRSSTAQRKARAAAKGKARAARKTSSPPQQSTVPHLDWCDGCDQVKPETVMEFTEGGLYRCAECRGEPKSPAPDSLKFLCWDCDKEHDGPTGRCPDCAEKFVQGLKRAPAAKRFKNLNDSGDPSDAEAYVKAMKAMADELRHSRDELHRLQERQCKMEDEAAYHLAKSRIDITATANTMTGRHIELNGVRSGQKVIAQGSQATIVVRGTVGEDAVLVAQGSNATITIKGFVGARAKITAQGSNAQVAYRHAAPSATIAAQGSNSRVRCCS